jgi:tRNA (mo5U34)-methyltransferase
VDGTEPTARAADELAERVAAVRWFHRMQLPGGVETQGVTDPGRNVLPQIGLPASLRGRSVLDIGAWDGFFSFEAERRGAADVLATDSYCWSGDGWGTKEGFELAREAYQSKVRDAEIDVMDLSPATVGVFDVVLFLGVLYHLRNPIEAIEHVASVTGDQLILETEVRLDWLPSAAAVLYPDRELSGDPTNWFAFNHRALVGLLRGSGFREVHIHSRTPALRRLGRMAYNRIREGVPMRQAGSRRIVVHARR